MRLTLLITVSSCAPAATSTSTTADLSLYNAQ